MALPRSDDLRRWQDTKDASLFKTLCIPKCLHDVMMFAEARFAPKHGESTLFWSQEKIADPTSWSLTLPCRIPGKRIEVPINDPIDKDDPEGHWRAILAAAADFQSLVNTGDLQLP